VEPIPLLYRRLVDRDFRVLLVIERLMKRYEYVPLEVIERRARLPPTHVAASLYKLNNLKMVKRVTGEYIGYKLTYRGLDMLAINALVRRGALATLSATTLGVGKESDVYTGETPGGEMVIVKFHRAGRTSFHQILRVRTYAPDHYHTWMELAKLAGQREYRALEELHRVGALVPRPIAYNRHVVVAQHVGGVELYRYKAALDPEAMLLKILETLRKAYLEVGIVHADLSEYNVLVVVDEEGEETPYIIDWPQYVEKDHPSAEALLRRDITYITRFFKRRFDVEVEPEKALRYVKGEAETV